MKRCIFVAIAWTLACGHGVQAQSVSSRAPIVPAADLATFSSPADLPAVDLPASTVRTGGIEVISREIIDNRSAPVTVSRAAASTTETDYTVKTVSASSPAVPQTQVSQGRVAAAAEHSGWRSVGSRPMVRTASASSQTYVAPRSSVVNYRSAAYPSSTVVGTGVANCPPTITAGTAPASGTVVQPPAVSAPAIAVPPPTTGAAVAAPGAAAATQVVTYPRYALRPLLPRQLPAQTYIDRGLVGNPRAYVVGQPVRNFFRYLIP